MSTINGNTTINGTLDVSNDMTANKDLHVRGWLYAANVANIYKGSFANPTELNDRWPAASCEDGWVAGVGNQTNGLLAYVFNASAGEWQNTNAKLYVDTNTDIAELQSGKVDKVGSATAGKIALLRSDGGITQQNSKSLSELANASHTHGNIANGGTIDTSEATAIKNKDKLVVLEEGVTIVGRDVMFDGSTTGKALTKAGTFEAFLTSHQDISGKADLVQSPTNGNLVSMNGSGNLTNSGKKAADFESVSNKVTAFSTPTDTQYPSALLTYKTIIEKMGLAVGEAVRVTFKVNDGEEGNYNVVTNFDSVKLIVKDGIGYKTQMFYLTAGEHVVSFVFNDPSTIPEKAFQNIDKIKSLHIPSFVRKIEDLAFSGTSLNYIDCEAMTPPVINSTPFGGLSLSDIKVHDVVKGKYTAAAEWSNYASVITIY